MEPDISKQARPACRLFAVITTAKLAPRAEALLHRGHAPLWYRFPGRGTASSEMLEVLGLGSSDKVVLFGMLPRSSAGAMLEKMQIELSLGAINSGIAFTVPITGSSNALVQLLQNCGAPGVQNGQEKEVEPMSPCSFSMVLAIVDQGFSEEVMTAARGAGARGGTVIHSRHVMDEEAMKFWGISIQPEKEIVLIVVKSDCRKAVMQAIGGTCGLQHDAHGLVVSVPVDGAIGLKTPDDD